MFAEDDVWPVLGAFDEAGFWWALEGGWGIDALVGHQTRSHGDLDPVIRWEDYEGAADLLRARGYAPVEDAWPTLPVRQLWRDAHHREVDLHPVWLDPTGGAWQSFGSDDSWGYYPPDGLRGAGCIAGRRVGCITPELQLRHRLGYQWRDADRHDLGLLGELFGLWIPPRDQQRVFWHRDDG